MSYETLRGRDQMRKQKRLHLPVTSTNLKIYGCVTMLFYSISMTVVQRGLLGMDHLTTEMLSQLMKDDPNVMILSGWASVLQLLGGLAVPVFAFQLVEGFLHTGSCKRYLIRMLAFAVISEVPYDFAMSGKLWDFSSQNTLFTLVVCLVMLYGLRLFSQKKGTMPRIVQLLIVLAAVFWSSLIKSNFGLCMVLLSAVYYLFYEKKGTRLMLGCAISLLYVTGPISTYVLWQYNGNLGKAEGKSKYIFYWLYPAHLLVLGVITYFLAR